MAFRGRLSPRRLALLLTLGFVVIAFAWLRYTGSAALSGMEYRDMDWDGDGELTRAEILQGVFSIVAVPSTQGRRHCVDYRQRGSGESIRVQCRTEAAP